MQKQLQDRLEKLQEEYQKGQQQLQKLEQERKKLYETMLRITGAMQVLKEELGKENEEAVPSAALVEPEAEEN